jgi:hypothetical protein
MKNVKYNIKNVLTFGLFNSALSTVCYIVSNGRMIVNYELERMWKEADVACINEIMKRVLSDEIWEFIV